MIYIFSSKKAALKRSLGQDKKNTWIEILPQIPKGFSVHPDDQVYLDISGLPQADLNKALGLIKKCVAFWGIIDPKGQTDDPASFFFKGASDYIGPALVKKGLSKKRFAAALSKFGDMKSSKKPADIKTETNKKIPKLPAGKFAGWKSIRPGKTEAFFFLFFSFFGKLTLRSLVGETVLAALKKHLRDVLQQYLWEANALLWMETKDSSLFLVPPRTANSRAAIEAALKMLLNSHLIGIEKLSMGISVEFTFALHYGKTIFQVPGKTGTVISEPVNYIFHLGTKKAETGRLTISSHVPMEAIPGGLLDFFTPAGIFEGIPVHHSKRFIRKWPLYNPE